jgi:hypothetical protein
MDELTAGQIAALERAVDAGEAAEDSGADSAGVIAAIEAELSTETFDAANAVRDALTSQQGETPADVIAAVEEVIDDTVDEALAASDMDTSLFVPLGVEEIREGTVRTEVIEDRDAALGEIAAEAAAVEVAALDSGATALEAAEQAQQAADDKREELLGKTTIVERVAEPNPVDSGNPQPVDTPPEAIVVLSNADDKVISTSGADDRFEVVPQVFVDATDTALGNQEFGRDVIVDLDDRVSLGGGSGEQSSGIGGASGDQTAQVGVDLGALGDVVYLEGVDGINDVSFDRHQVGREGMNSLKISTTVESTDDQGNAIANAGEVNIFKQFDPLTDRFAVETLELADTQGNSEYWSLSTTEAVRDGGRVTDTYIQTDVSNTGKGILIGSDDTDDTYVVNGDAAGVGAEVMVVGFDGSDTIDLSSFAGVDEELTATLNADTGNVELSVDDEVRLTLLGTGLAEEDLSTALILSES